MTALDDLRARLRPYRCEVILGADGQPKLKEYGEAPPTELVAEARRCRAALLVELLRAKAWELRGVIDGQATYEQRVAKIAEFQETTDRLAEAQERLLDSWGSAGFKVVWSALVEEFILVGDGLPPPGSEGYAVYTWAEVATLRETDSETIRSAHRVKKAFAGTMKPCVT